MAPESGRARRRRQYGPPAHGYAVGQLVSLDLGEWHRPDVPVEVAELVDDGRLLLRFPLGGTLYVHPHHVTPYRKART